SNAGHIENGIADRNPDPPGLIAAPASEYAERQVLNGKLVIAVGALDKAAARRIVCFVRCHDYTRERPPSHTILTPVLLLRYSTQAMMDLATSSGWTTRLSGVASASLTS